MNKCPYCESGLRNVIFDVGYSVNVESLHCDKCGFNITKEDNLEKAISSLREKMR